MTEQRLPENYVDPSLPRRDQELLRIFYTASLSEGGSADEVTLRGIRAIADWQLEQVLIWIRTNLGRTVYLKPMGFKMLTDWAVDVDDVLDDLEKAMRRPKPPSLKEQALDALAGALYLADDSPPEGISTDQANIIRRALESIPE